MSPDEQHVLDLERALLDPAVRSNAERVTALLDDDFLEFGASGRRWTKDDTVANLAAAPPEAEPIEMTDAHATEIAPGVVLVTYVARNANRSSIWRHAADGEWRIRFHQGTPVP